MTEDDHKAINSADEFKSLCEASDDTTLFSRTATDEIWLDILRKYPELSICVAGNKTLSETLIDQLSTDKNPDVRWRIAMKRRLTLTIFNRLANDPDSTVRHRIACNPKTPRELLLQLTLDSDALVLDAASKRV